MEPAGPGEEDEKVSLSGPSLGYTQQDCAFFSIRTSEEQLSCCEEPPGTGGSHTDVCVLRSQSTATIKKQRSKCSDDPNLSFPATLLTSEDTNMTSLRPDWSFKFLREKMVFCSTKFCSTLLHHCIRHLSHCGNKYWQKSLKEGRIYLAHSSKERSLPWGEDMVAEEEWSHCVYCQETDKDGGWCSTHFLLCIQLGFPACGMVPPTCGRHHFKYPNLVAPLQTYPQVCLHVS